MITWWQETCLYNFFDFKEGTIYIFFSFKGENVWATFSSFQFTTRDSEIKPNKNRKCPNQFVCVRLVHQSYRPSCSQTSTRKSTISLRGIGWGNSLLLPSKLSYDAVFQFILDPRLRLLALSFPTQRSLVWFQRRSPWFTNSGGGFEFLATDWESKVWFDDDMLPPWEGKVMLSISTVLVDQRSSETLGFLTVWAMELKGGSFRGVSGDLGSL